MFDAFKSRRRATWWQRVGPSRLHGNPAWAGSFWWLLIAAGVGAIAWSLARLAPLPSGIQMQILAGTLIAISAGYFPLRRPLARQTFVASEIFVFLLLLTIGVDAAVLAAACHTLVAACRSSMPWRMRAVRPAMAAVSMLAAGSVFNAAWHFMLPTFGVTSVAMLAPMLCSAFVYLALEGSGIATLRRLQGECQTPDAALRVAPFSWLALSHAGSAATASLLYLAVWPTGTSVLLTAAPVLALLLVSLHYFCKQQVFAHEALQARTDNTERQTGVENGHGRDIAESERRFNAAFTQASVGMALVTPEGRVLKVNGAFENLIGFGADRLCGRDLVDHVLTGERRLLTAQLQRAQRHEIDSFGVEVTLMRQDGRGMGVSLNGSIFSERDSVAPCLIVQVHDVSARRDAETQLQHIAFHDGLTGLSNRRRFNQHLDHAIERAKRDPHDCFAVLFLDCDQFKLINDSMGHGVGDDFLVELAQRVLACTRPEDLVSRLGGDEFAVLVRGVSDRGAITHLADRLLESLRRPMMAGHVPVISSVSIGVTFSSMGYLSRAEVLRDADLAMYAAKSQGRDQHACFDETMRASTQHRVQLEIDLRAAAASKAFEVVYQPLFNIRNGALTGFEALCRWHHPTHGPIPPTTFVPIAEEIGVIGEITEFMLNQAAGQLRDWQRIDAAFEQLQVHVNISASDLAQADFGRRVARCLERSGLAARCLVVEVTENAVMNRMESAAPVFADLKALGVLLSIDDFGTGFSSLANLSKLPISSLKIHGSFVRDLSNGNKQTEIVRAIVSLGSTLGKIVMAEGIESDSQMAALNELGCQGGQGYLLAQPLSAREARDLLMERQPAPPVRAEARRRGVDSAFAAMADA